MSLDRDFEARSAEAALEIGVDLLMGGVHPEAVLPLVAATNVMYSRSPDASSTIRASSRDRSRRSPRARAG